MEQVNTTTKSNEREKNWPEKHILLIRKTHSTPFVVVTPKIKEEKKSEKWIKHTSTNESSSNPCKLPFANLVFAFYFVFCCCCFLFRRVCPCPFEIMKLRLSTFLHKHLTFHYKMCFLFPRFRYFCAWFVCGLRQFSCAIVFFAILGIVNKNKNTRKILDFFPSLSFFSYEKRKEKKWNENRLLKCKLFNMHSVVRTFFSFIYFEEFERKRAKKSGQHFYKYGK